MTMLSGPRGAETRALAINNHGLALVISEPNGSSSIRQLCTWDKTTGMKQLNTGDCELACINDLGQILAMCPVPGKSYSWRWFLVDPDGQVPPNAFPPGTMPRDINNRSYILGLSQTTKGQTYLTLQHGEEAPRQLARVDTQLRHATLNDSNQVVYTEIRESRWRESFLRIFGPNTSLGYHVSSFLWDPHRGLIPLDRYLHGVRRFWVHGLNNSG
jgi:hypothetical protein